MSGSLAPGKPPMTRRPGGHQTRSRRFGKEKNPLPLVGFESRTIQPIYSRYTDYATQALTDHVAALYIMVGHNTMNQVQIPDRNKYRS
jgi:hypothetical protein